MSGRLNETEHRQELESPIFYDVTLRDGNQALARPMTPEQKLRVFNWLMELGIKHVEVGFPAASDLDFTACKAIAEQAPQGTTIAVLARCRESDIQCAVRALNYTKPLAIPRLHIFIGMSEFHLANVLEKEPEQVKAMAIAGVRQAKMLLSSLSLPTQIQFSPEHFGDCQNNLEWVIESLKEIVAAGADIINLPNTVERTTPAVFIDMVRQVVKALPPSVVVSVHCHNDLGMATATTVGSYFAGARQLEVTLNGIGERAGNTSLYETALALSISGAPIPLNLRRFYDIALSFSELVGVKIPAKAPLIGQECFYHRSGIHQHGAVRTLERAKRAYLPLDPAIIGRAGDEELRFTSQSGQAAVMAIIKEAGWMIDEETARLLQPALKAAAEQKGELAAEEIVRAYQEYLKLKASKAQVDSSDIVALVSSVINRGQQIWQRVFVRAVAGDHPSATICLRRNGGVITKVALGDGPVDAAFESIRQITMVNAVLEDYSLKNVTEGGDSLGKVVCHLSYDGYLCQGSGAGTDIVVASVDAYLDALNRLLEAGKA